MPRRRTTGAWIDIASVFFFGVVSVPGMALRCQLPGILVLRAHETPPAIVLAMMALGSAGPGTVALWFWILEKRASQRVLPERRAWLHSRLLLWTRAPRRPSTRLVRPLQTAA